MLLGMMQETVSGVTPSNVLAATLGASIVAVVNSVTNTRAMSKNLREMKLAMNGFGERMETLAKQVVGLSTVVIGIDGRNGLKSETRDLTERLGHVERQTDRHDVEMKDLERRVDDVERP